MLGESEKRPFETYWQLPIIMECDRPFLPAWRYIVARIVLHTEIDVKSPGHQDVCAIDCRIQGLGECPAWKVAWTGAVPGINAQFQPFSSCPNVLLAMVAESI